MNIVIFSGGTGSINLQKGLKEFLTENDNYSVIINCYDNGKSTGAVRKVMHGKILGPSDLRKNQEVRSLLSSTLNGSILMELKSFLDIRGEATSAEEFRKLMINKLLSSSLIEKKLLLENAINAFFNNPEAENITYTDFSYANVIYAGLSSGKLKDILDDSYSLERAGRLMESVLGIKEDSVTLISDDSLFLQAITKNGDIILDEGDIVQWNNSENPIVDIQLVNTEGDKKIPEISNKSKKLIEDADLIIFSSGTQWSSLIPTYIHKDFYSIIEKSKAKKYLVMNNTDDQDMKDVDSLQLISILEKYLPIKDIKIVYNTYAKPLMRKIHTDYKHIYLPLSDHTYSISSVKHDPYKLAKAIIQDFTIGDLNKFDDIIFDFDDTLYGRKNSYPVESLDNLKHFSNNRKNLIITGNSLNHINSIFQNLKLFKNSWEIYNEIYTDGGNSKCVFDTDLKRFVFKEYLHQNLVLTKNDLDRIYSILKEENIPVFKIENRNNMIISIKPLSNEDRNSIHQNLSLRLSEFDVVKTGKTTIDIYVKGYNKGLVLEHESFKNRSILYIGDEIDNGNDSSMKLYSNVTLIRVNNPKETNHFLKIIS